MINIPLYKFYLSLSLVLVFYWRVWLSAGAQLGCLCALTKHRLVFGSVNTEGVDCIRGCRTGLKKDPLAACVKKLRFAVSDGPDLREPASLCALNQSVPI